MSTPSHLLQDGVAALKQGDYAAAIPSLKAFCESPSAPESEAYAKVSKLLVQAYIKQEQRELALELCIQLAESKSPELQQWAHRAIPVLEEQIPTVAASQGNNSQGIDSQGSDSQGSDSQGDDSQGDDSQSSPVIDPAEAAGQIKQAVQAFRQRNYAEVITLLQPLSAGLAPQSANYALMQMTLAKAYQAEGLLEEAQTLGQVMVASDRDDLRIWGEQFLNHLSSRPASQRSQATPKPASTDSATTTATATNSATVLENTASGAEEKPALIQTTVSGIAYQPPAAPLPSPTQHQPPRETSPATVQTPASSTRVMQSVLSHGSVTFLASAALYTLFPIGLALPIDLLRWSIPVVIYYTAQDPIAKENAKQATNYVITTAIITVLVWVGGFFLFAGILGMALLFVPLLILLLVPLAIYGTMLSLWPVAGAFICLANPNNTFDYPKWLIWRVIR